MARILIIDDEALILNVLKSVLTDDGHEALTANGGQQALDLISTQRFDLVISDLRMAPMDGIEVLRQLRARGLSTPVIMITAYGTVKSAVDALSLDVFDFVSKPFKVDELLATVHQALLYGQAVAAETSSAENLPATARLGPLIAASPSMMEACEMIRKVAPVDIPVSIFGEYGVGKEAIARTIHELSPRKANKFVTVACSELPEPLFEALLFGTGDGDDGVASFQAGTKSLMDEARGGTLFMSDADLIPATMQEKILKHLQDASSNHKTAAGVRLIAAITWKPDGWQSADTSSPAFVRDLGGVDIHIPALRDRREDILPLAIHILQLKTDTGKAAVTVTPDARDALVQYNWPGNVSELDKAMDHALAHIVDGKITRKSLPPRVQNGTSEHDSKAKRDQMFGKNKLLKSFLSKPLQQLKHDTGQRPG